MNCGPADAVGPANVEQKSSSPSTVYRERAAHFRDVLMNLRGKWNVLAGCRFALVLAAIALFWTVVGGRSLAWYWILVPVFAFIALSRPAERSFGRLRYAERAIDFYEYGLARLETVGRGADVPGPSTSMKPICTPRTWIYLEPGRSSNGCAWPAPWRGAIRWRAGSAGAR